MQTTKVARTSSRMECHRIPRQAQPHHWEPDSFRRMPGHPPKLEGSHQQGPQEDRDRMGRGNGGHGGIVSPNVSSTPDEPGISQNLQI